MWQSEQDHWPNTGSQCHSGCPSGPWLASSYCSTRAQVFYSSNVTSARHLQTPWIPHQGISNDTGSLHWCNWLQLSVRKAWKPKDPKLVSQIHNYFKIVMRSSPVISGCFNWQVFNWSMQSFFFTCLQLIKHWKYSAKCSLRWAFIERITFWCSSFTNRLLGKLQCFVKILDWLLQNLDNMFSLHKWGKTYFVLFSMLWTFTVT